MKKTLLLSAIAISVIANAQNQNVSKSSDNFYSQINVSTITKL